MKFVKAKKYKGKKGEQQWNKEEECTKKTFISQLNQQKYSCTCKEI